MAGTRAESLVRLEGILLELRRSLSRPGSGTLAVPSLGKVVTWAKVVACDALADLTPDGGAVSIKDLAAGLHLDHSTVSRLLGEAETEGLVARGPDPQDARRTLVRLTPEGHEVTARSRDRKRQVLSAVFADWPEEGVASFVDRIADLAHGLARFAALEAENHPADDGETQDDPAA